MHPSQHYSPVPQNNPRIAILDISIPVFQCRIIPQQGRGEIPSIPKAVADFVE
jgi:hypothetical protein